MFQTISLADRLDVRFTQARTTRRFKIDRHPGDSG